MAFPWKLTKGTWKMHVCSIQPLSMLTDHNMKMEPIAPCPLLSISLCLHVSNLLLPFAFSSITLASSF